jgi:Raf kinase inhibitor-like YbhB/YbcL family protein
VNAHIVLSEGQQSATDNDVAAKATPWFVNPPSGERREKIPLYASFTSTEHIMQLKIFSAAALCTSMTLAVVSTLASAESFTIKVDGLSHGHFSNEQVYGGFGCHGNNVSPRISWAHVPRGTKSVVVTIFDPDAPTGGLGWTHWEIANIPPSASSLEKGASGNPKLLPAGAVETLTDFGESRYGGPCPPQGESHHRYVVTASALNVAQLDVAPAASPAVVAYQMHGKVVAHAKYVVRYHRALTAD